MRCGGYNTCFPGIKTDISIYMITGFILTSDEELTKISEKGRGILDILLDISVCDIVVYFFILHLASLWAIQNTNYGLIVQRHTS